MPELTHFAKLDSTERQQTGTTPAEETNYTVSWANLTGAGFSAGDDVLVLVFAKLRTNNNGSYVRFQVGFGTTYAGRADEADSYESYEPSGVAAHTMYQYMWFDRRTLVTNENIYFSLWRGAAVGTLAAADEFVCLVLKLSELASTDWGYAEAAHSGNAPTTYNTSGASFTTGAAGDWLLLGFTHWLIDSVTADYLVALSADGVDYAEAKSEGEDVENEINWGTAAYRASLGSGKTCRVRYRTDTAHSHDASATKIFGLRLDAFANHWGAHTTNTITHTVLDTYQEFAGNGAFDISATGKVLALGFPIHNPLETTHFPYGRIQLANSDFDATDRNRSAVRDNGVDMRTIPMLIGYGTVSAGSTDWDFDCAEDQDVSSGTFDTCVEQIAAVFTLMLASAGGQPAQMRGTTIPGMRQWQPGRR